MSLESVRAFFAAKAPDIAIIEMETSTATVAQAAEAHGVSLRAFDEVVPAAGSIHTAVRIAPERIADLTGAEWVDVCQAVEATA